MISFNRPFCRLAAAAIIGVVIGSSAMLAPAARAEDVSAELLNISTPVYAPAQGEFQPPLGTYTYEVAWQGIPAAELTVSLKEENENYRVITAARTNSAIDIFYKLRYRAEGIISAFDLSPHKTFIDNRENSRQKTIQITFHKNGDIESIRSQKEGPPKVMRFNTSNFTLDPFSAAFLARSLDWEKGVSRDFDTFNGKTRYLITLTAVDKVKMVVNGRTRDVWVVTPKVKNLNNPEANSKLREAKIYVTADPSREILQIVSKVFIGSVTTKLVSFTPAQEFRAPLQMAQQQTQRVSFKFF